MGGEGRWEVLLGSWLLLMMVMFWDGTGRFIGIGYAIYGNLDVARGTKMAIGWRVLPKAARVKEILEFPQIEFSSRHCNNNTTTYLPNLLNTLRIRASSGAILLPPIPDRETHCDGCDRGYVRVASRADNGSRIDDSPTSLTDTAIRPPSLSYLSSIAVRFRYCPPSAVDSSLLQHYASVDDRNRIICS